MSIGEIVVLIINLITLGGLAIGFVFAIIKLINGQKCLLRSEMLRIYYRHQAEKSLRQFEYENFFMLYDAYKKLGGNSFIDKVAAEIKEWKVTL